MKHPADENLRDVDSLHASESYAWGSIQQGAQDEAKEIGGNASRRQCAQIDHDKSSSSTDNEIAGKTLLLGESC